MHTHFTVCAYHTRRPLISFIIKYLFVCFAFTLSRVQSLWSGQVLSCHRYRKAFYHFLHWYMVRYNVLNCGLKVQIELTIIVYFTIQFNLF